MSRYLRDTTLDKILKGLQDNKGKSLKLKKTSTDKEALEKLAHSLRTQARKFGGMYARIGFVINNEGSLYRLYAVWNKKAAKGGKTKDKTKGAKKKTQPAATLTPDQSEAMQDMEHKNLIMLINSGMMQPDAMSKILAANQDIVATMQKELEAQGTTEERKAVLNKQMQYKHELIEAIKKKLGQ